MDRTCLLEQLEAAHDALSQLVVELFFLLDFRCKLSFVDFEPHHEDGLLDLSPQKVEIFMWEFLPPLPQ